MSGILLGKMNPGLPGGIAMNAVKLRSSVAPQTLQQPRPGAHSVPRFGNIDRLFTVGPNPMDRIRPESAPNIPELLTIQRAFSEYALKVELCAKTADAVSGVVRRLQQGG